MKRNPIFAVPGLFALCAVIFLAAGCARRTPSTTIVLVDPSASVTMRARQEEFAAVARRIPRLLRGDSLLIIPITNDAEAGIEGRVLRFHAPAEREAYDADLRRFRHQADKQLGAFANELLQSPVKRTDILGALDVARQEFEAAPRGDRRTLIVLSDFLEDDGSCSFVNAPQLANKASAARFAQTLQEQHRFHLQDAAVQFGGLEGDDLANLSPARREAVHAFWEEYFRAAGVKAEIRIDGIAVFE